MDELPRLADLVVWLSAREPGLGWTPGAFQDAYRANREDGIELALSADPVAQAVRRFADRKASWEGTATQLLDKVNRFVEWSVRQQGRWPRAAHTLSNRLRRLAPGLRAVGVNIILDRRDPSKNRDRLILIEKVGEQASEASGPSDRSGMDDKNENTEGYAT